MKISAVIPTYNNASYICAAIESIQAQTYPVNEIIVVDDGSSDETEQIIRELAGKDYRIIYHKQANRGPSTARNKGIEISTGDWIAFLDADDQWTREKIARQLQALQQNPSLHLIAGDMTEIDKTGNTITPSVLAKHGHLPGFSELAGKPLAQALKALLIKNFIPTGTVLAKRETLIEANLFNQKIRFGEDLELWAKIASRHPIACLPEVLMLRRLHDNNATRATKRMLTDLVNVNLSISDYAGKELIEQGLNPKQLISDSYWELGYWHFSNGAIHEARAAFGESLKLRASLRSAIYFVVCLLPPIVISTLRRYKQCLTE